MKDPFAPLEKAQPREGRLPEAFSPKLRHIARYGATAILSYAAGWFIGTTGTPASATAPYATSSTRSSASHAECADPAPLIAVTSDGIATLRVEQQPLEWVLEEIAKQSGWSDIKQRAGAAALPATIAATPAPAIRVQVQQVMPELLERLKQKLEHGAELDRFNALLQARSEGVALPDDLLKRLVETDASDRVRLLAFETYLKPRRRSADAMRGALEAALHVPNGAIQREARWQLDRLLESERLEAVTVDQADP